MNTILATTTAAMSVPEKVACLALGVGCFCLAAVLISVRIVNGPERHDLLHTTECIQATPPAKEAAQEGQDSLFSGVESHPVTIQK